MDCSSSSVEIQTILSRIEDGDINLQPDFQRGEVWSINKKKKLIDSILRGWNIPPIHVVEGEKEIDEVLDGQQRLNSIKCFYDNEFPIDGSIQPSDSFIQGLDYCYYRDLPDDVKRKFKKYIITIVRLSKFKPEEPAELFYRLNQPATLTAAEQRNAYIGYTRGQIKELVNGFVAYGADKNTIGFSNSRLAYDEIISKFAYLIEEGTLKKKITANDISKRYRNDEKFMENTIKDTEKVLLSFMQAVDKDSIYKPKFSKATLLSWFIFIKGHENLEKENLRSQIYFFEGARDFLKGKHLETVKQMSGKIYEKLLENYGYFESMINMFNQRASMGSTDALSIVYRDIILNVFHDMLFNKESAILNNINKNYFEENNFGVAIDKVNKMYFWGDKF